MWASWGRPGGSWFPTKLLKLASGLMGGFDWWLLHWFPIPSFISLTHFHAYTYPFIDPSIICVLAWEREPNCWRISHEIVGCNGHWCNPAMTWDLDVWDALDCALVFSQLRVLRVLALRFWTIYVGGPKIKGEVLSKGLHCREWWRSILLGQYRLGRRDLGTWIVVDVGKPMRYWELIGLGTQVLSGTILVDS